MPRPEQSSESIFGARASYYTTSAAHTDAEVLAAVVRLSQAQATWRVLDVGTGTGHTAFALAPHVREVIGLDPTPEMLAEAEKLRLSQGHANVRWEVGDVHALPYEDGAFTLVTCRRAAHHFADIELALKEMIRVLAPSGRLVIDDRSGPEDDALDELMNHLDLLHDRSHVRQYRPSAWDAMLQAAGLEVDAIEPYTKHRPLSALTEVAEPEDRARIEEIVSGFADGQRQAFDARIVDGELHTTHWYVLAAGAKAAGA